MKAVIMAGGEGKRLKPFTQIVPKPLLPMGEKPILELIIEKLKRFGVNEVILSTNYKAYLFELLFKDGSDHGIKIKYSKEDSPLGTAGPLSLVKGDLNEDFIVLNGDILANELDFTELMKFHKEQNADMTLVTKKTSVKIEHGMIKVSGDSVVGWEEKPEIESEICTGIYAFSPRVLEFLPPNQHCDMHILTRKLLDNGLKVNRFIYEGDWIDVGRPESFLEAQNKHAK